MSVAMTGTPPLILDEAYCVIVVFSPFVFSSSLKRIHRPIRYAYLQILGFKKGFSERRGERESDCEFEQTFTI